MTPTPLLQSFNFANMGEGTAILIVGILFLLLIGSVRFQNSAGAVAWGFSFILFVMSGVLDLPAELFWIGVISTGVILIAGLIARWSL